MKDEKGGKIITKYAAKDPKSYSYSVLKNAHEMKDLEFIRVYKSKRMNKMCEYKVTIFC